MKDLQHSVENGDLRKWSSKWKQEKIYKQMEIEGEIFVLFVVLKESRH